MGNTINARSTAIRSRVKPEHGLLLGPAAESECPIQPKADRIETSGVVKIEEPREPVEGLS